MSQASTQITQQHLLGGTPSYIAPERISDPTRIDPRSDIYALGAVAFYLLTPRDVVSGASPEEVLLRAMKAEPVRPSHYVSGIPESLDALVLRCLARNPDDRPETMAEVSSLL